MALPAVLSPAELAEIRAYHAPIYVWALVRDGVNLGFFALLLRFGVRALYRLSERGVSAVRSSRPRAAGPLRRALDLAWGGDDWPQALGFASLLLLVEELVYFPKDFYFGFIHEHRFGLSNYTLGGFLFDEVKGFSLRWLVTLLLAFSLFALARRWRRWWLVLGLVAGVGLCFSGVLDPYRDRVYFTHHDLEAGPLRERLVALLAQAKLPAARIWVVNSSRTTKTVDAYFAGEGASRAIVLGDELVRDFSVDEVVAAVAHEAGHLGEARWARRLLSALALLAFLWGAEQLMAWAARRRWFGVTARADIRTLPLLTLMLYVLMNLAGPVANAASQRRELEADRFALELTRDPAAFERMLWHACKVNKMDPAPPGWIVTRFHDHPPLDVRLAQVHAFEANEKSSAGEQAPTP